MASISKHDVEATISAYQAGIVPGGDAFDLTKPHEVQTDKDNASCDKAPVSGFLVPCLPASNAAMTDLSTTSIPDPTRFADTMPNANSVAKKRTVTEITPVIGPILMPPESLPDRRIREYVTASVKKCLRYTGSIVVAPVVLSPKRCSLISITSTAERTQTDDQTDAPRPAIKCASSRGVKDGQIVSAFSVGTAIVPTIF